MNELITSTSALTMNTLEIAQLLDKEHKTIKLSAERLAKKFIIQLSPIVKVKNNQSLSANNMTGVYELNKESSLILVAQNSPELTARIIRRWQELEEQQKPALPTVKELAMMVIKAEEEKEAAQLEVTRLQGVCNTITAQFAAGTTAPVFCRQLNGVNINKVNATLVEMGMLRSVKKRGLEPTAYSRDLYFKVSHREWHNESTNKSGVSADTTLTLKGAKWLYRAYLSNKLVMKENWDGNFSHVEFEA